MYLENVVFDAVDPQRVGRFWEAAIDGERLTDEEAGFETRLAVEGGPVLDLCFQRVPDRPTDQPRLHLDLAAGPGQDVVVERLLGLGARQLRTGRGERGEAVLRDPEFNAFCVLAEDATYAGSGPIAALPLESADPARDAEFWSWLTGWTPVTGNAPQSLRHPSLLGPLLELRLEEWPKETAKNRLHLDVRLEAGEDADEVADAIAQHGGRELHFDWGDLPWRHFADPSGNEFCVLRART